MAAAPPPYDHMMKLTQRLASFNNGRKRTVQSVQPIALAKRGFYLAVDNKITCFQCHLTLDEWPHGKDPLELHREMSPDCPFLSPHAVRASPPLACNGVDDAVAGAVPQPSVHTNGIVVTDAVNDTPEETEPNTDHPAEPPSVTTKSRKRRQRKKNPVTESVLPAQSEESGRETSTNGATSAQPAPQSVETTAKDAQEVDQLKTENQKMMEAKICKVCLLAPMCVVFLPCGHLVCCARCAAAVHTCPICRTIIKGTVSVMALPGDVEDAHNHDYDDDDDEVTITQHI